MKNRLLLSGVIALLLTCLNDLSAQDSTFMPPKVFDQDFLENRSTDYRSASGKPGPDYWQNEADYDINIRLDTTRNRISGQTVITYTNNSPDTLRQLWLHIDSNYLRQGSKQMKVHAPGRNVGWLTGGVNIKAVEYRQNGSWKEVSYEVHDTRMVVFPPAGVRPEGHKATLRIEYSYEIPSKGYSRQGVLTELDNKIFSAAYWYPRMAVYDDVRGWNTLPFLGSGEFYMEYGDFEYSINVPWNMIVAGSGTLKNPKEVLTREQRRRLKAARGTDQTTYIIKPDEAGTREARPVNEGRLTWTFTMQNTRDVAWVASTDYIWDASRIDLPNNETALAMSVYPEESMGDSAWNRSTDYLERSVEIFSNDWFAYPYETAWSVAVPAGGMEYPGLAFCSWKADGYLLWLLVNHEIGHTWYPMIVGSNERRHAWMDEGFNTFIDIYATEKYNKGEYAPKRDGEYAPEGGNPAREITDYMKKPSAKPIMTPPDMMDWDEIHTLHYYKSALGLVLLREEILGPRRFDRAFRAYTRRWAFRHPQPADFFQTMNDVAGEDLSWFWKGWYARDWTLDQAVDSVEYIDGKPSKGARITIENRDKLVMPLTVRVVDSDGDHTTHEFPVEIWKRGFDFTFRHTSGSKVDSVIVDPGKNLPDVKPDNNVWSSQP